jgi:carbon-monoxide dehydrogenase medium subunit
VAFAVPLLARSTPFVGQFQIRNRGTVGGSLAHADPAAEYPAVALALGATLETLAPDGPRTIAAAGFFTGLWSTALDADELLTGVSFPVWSGRCGFGFEELARRHGDFAIAGAAVALELDDQDRVVRCGIGLLGLGPTPVRAAAAEAGAAGEGIGEIDAGELGRVAVAGLDAMPSDVHGSPAYRARVGAAMVARAWTAAVGEARGA